MAKAYCKPAVLLMTFFVITLLAWPIVAFFSVLVGYFFADAELAIRFGSEPKRLLLADFLQAYRMSLPLALCIAFYACGVLVVMRNKIFPTVSVFTASAVVMVLVSLFYVPASAPSIAVLLLTVLCLVVIITGSAFLLKVCGSA